MIVDHVCTFFLVFDLVIDDSYDWSFLNYKVIIWITEWIISFFNSLLINLSLDTIFSTIFIIILTYVWLYYYITDVVILIYLAIFSL